MATGRERRRFPRLSCGVSLEYMPVEEGRTIPYASTTKNISTGGICIIAFERLADDQILDISFSLPRAAAELKARGKVAWVNELRIANQTTSVYEVGIEFIKVSEEDQKLLNQFIFNQPE